MVGGSVFDVEMMMWQSCQTWQRNAKAYMNAKKQQVFLVDALSKGTTEFWR